MTDVYSAPFTVQFAYTRSTGPILEQFFNALGEHRILGAKRPDGRVLVPPAEYDPETSAELTELIEVGSEGTVTTFSWNDTPREGQPLDHPFAWALIKLDGADSAMLHAVDGPVEIGTRVRVRWRAGDEPIADIGAIECFEVVT